MVDYSGITKIFEVDVTAKVNLSVKANNEEDAARLVNQFVSQAMSVPHDAIIGYNEEVNDPAGYIIRTERYSLNIVESTAQFVEED